ncbi:unnamed protein product [Rhizophagus irregularis]|nr:unnamed protein product [Rhizophagus irregularis]CAB5386543.1 unnamed protein product [Rhizophagus irregularis]
MTGQNKKTQSTSQRKNISSQEEAGRNVTSSEKRNTTKNIHPSSDNFNRKIPVSSSQTEVEELNRQIFELQSKNNELSQQYNRLEQETEQLRFNNDELTKQNNFLQVQIENYEFLQSLDVDNASQNENVSDDGTRPAKRQMRKKTSDEEEKAKVLMRTLLKTFPELELKEGETFKSEANVKICQELIPKLQKEMKVYNPTYEQLNTWLQSYHKSKRNAYNRSNQLNRSNPTSLNNEFGYLLEAESDDAIRSAKRETKSKGRKSNNFSEDDDELKVEEGAKSLMKALLKTYPYEFNLKVEDTFKSQINTEICDSLIPKLQREVKSAYNLSYEQVESWLQTFHRYKRNTYLKQLNLSSLNNEVDNSQEADSDGSIQSAKRQTKSKGRNPSNLSEDEDGLKIEEGAKILMRTLLKTFPSELNLRGDETFKSKTNVEICQKLIPRLRKEMKAYNPSYEQVETWLQSIHRSKRYAYLKSNQLNQSNPMPLDDELDYLQEVESDVTNRPAAIRQTKPKERKPSNVSEDEDEDELKYEEGSKIGEGAKSLMRRLLDKTYTQNKYKLKIEETFKSQVNTDICEVLIPKLQEDVKPVYNLSYKQVETWLQSIHKSKRKTYLKSNRMDIDE